MKRGANASTSTPTTAAPNTISIGASWLYSMLGGLIVAAATAAWTAVAPGAAETARTPVTAGFPSALRSY